MDFAYLLSVIWRKKWIIAGATLLAALIAFLFSYLQPRFYSSTAQYSTGVGAQKISLSGLQGSGWSETEIGINNVIATFKSPTVLGMVSYRLLLDEIARNKENGKQDNSSDQKKKQLFDFVHDDSTSAILRDKLNNQVILNPTIPYEKRILDALDEYGFGYASMSKNIRINRIPGTDYLDVVFRSNDPNISAMVVNTVGIEYLRFYEFITNQRGKQTADTIASFMQTQQKKVDSLTNLLIEEKKRQGAVNPEQASNLALQTVTTLQQRLTEEKARYNTASSTYESLKNQLQVLQGSVSGATGATEEILRLQSRKRELLAEMNERGGNDPDIRNQLDQINRKIASSAGTPTSMRKKERIDDINLQLAEQQGIIQASSKTISDLESQIRSTSGKTNIGAGNEIKMTALWSTLDIENRQLVQIKDKYIQAQGLLKEAPNAAFRQTLIGQPSTEPDPDKSMINMGIAGTSALFMTSFLFLLGTLLNPSIRTPSQFRKITSLPLVAVLNQIKSLNNNGSVEDALTQADNHPDNILFREQLRKLRFALENSGKRKLLVTSLKKGVGKTTVIQALAHTMKMSRKRVLLIDTNFHDNKLSREFTVQAYLEDTAKMFPQPEQMKKVITKTNDPFIDIIASKGGSYTPSELLPTQNILGQLDHLLKEYDYVILEGPAMNQHADSHELVRYVDGVLAVFGADEKISPADTAMLEKLESMEKTVIGTVLNRVARADIEA
jgi:Mrp family chromosome partitioning ATPase/uncharacterized protein involved in exopolysaccharide biosynthesis